MPLYNMQFFSLYFKELDWLRQRTVTATKILQSDGIFKNIQESERIFKPGDEVCPRHRVVVDDLVVLAKDVVEAYPQGQLAACQLEGLAQGSVQRLPRRDPVRRQVRRRGEPLARRVQASLPHGEQPAVPHRELTARRL